MRPTCAALAIALGLVTLNAQTPEFDVASVKPGAPGSPQLGVSVAGSQVTATNATLRRLVAWAYNILPARHDILDGGPAWIDTDSFAIVAKTPGRPSMDDARQMMRQLLAQRFKLRLHTEKREVPVFALVLAKKDGAFGPGLKRSTHDCAAINEAIAAGRIGIARTADCALRNQGNVAQTAFRGSGGMAALIFVISRGRDIDRPIVDRTGLTGTFDIDLTFNAVRLAQPGSGNAEIPVPAEGTSLFTALQEQLGLKLESRRDTVTATVIDSAERPTPD